MSLDLSGKHVVVTGGAGALGSAVVARLESAGAVCHIPRYEEGIDLTSEESAVGWFSQLTELWASVHVAGGFAMSPLTETSLDAFMHQLRMNMVTSFLASREAVKLMRKSGGQGRLVNVAARPVLVPTGGMVAYTASKGGVAAMTTALSEELRGEGIYVNAVVPSIIDTPMNRQSMPNADHIVWPSTADLAETIAFLASPANRATSGAIVPVYGRA